jgi:hypothetical protein
MFALILEKRAMRWMKYALSILRQNSGTILTASSSNVRNILLSGVVHLKGDIMPREGKKYE